MNDETNDTYELTQFGIDEMRELGYHIEGNTIFGLRRLSFPKEEYQCFMCKKWCFTCKDISIENDICDCKPMNNDTKAEFHYYCRKEGKETINDFWEVNET